METIKWAVNRMPGTEDASLKVMDLSQVKKARAFHESFPQYSVTPLAKLEKMADYLGLGAEARFNYPSTIGTNWKWRLLPEECTKELAEKIRAMTRLYGRL